MIEGVSFPEGVLVRPWRSRRVEYTSNHPAIPHHRQPFRCGGSTLAEA
ncbi:hypothetical protein ACF3DV_22880 [Chlorogloeopsis fritschii PCC 9212]|nr:hypothetical protein [Chlorogloeopsis fritschii]